MPSPLLLELHAHGRKAVDITPWTKRVQWGESINAPWDSMAVELALPLGEIELRAGRYTDNRPPITATSGFEKTLVKQPRQLVDVAPGLWLKLTEYATGRMLSMARIDTRPLNLRAGPKGSISNRVSLQALGAWSFIRTLAVEFVVGTINEDYGGIMAAGGPAAKRYYALFQRLIRGPLASEIVGASGIIATLAPVQIPETLVPGVSTLGELFRIAWGPGELGKAAPLRTMTRVPLADTAALAYVLPQGTALDMITAIYQREPRLIELFPSMEAPTNDPMKPGYADARPTIIHRIAPLITGPLSKMVVETGDAPNVSIPTTYDKPTWSLANGLTLKANEGFAMSPTRSEAARVNVVTVNWSVAGGSEARWLTPAGLPIADRADIDQHGARLLELNWDLGAGIRRAPARSFNDLNARLNGARGGGSISDRLASIQNSEQNAFRTLRTVGLLGWHFYGLGHVFEAGTIEGDYLGLRARAGEPLSFDYGGKRPFTAYMTGVTHTAEVKDRGVFSARTSIQFDRGLWDERLRDPHVYRETKAAPKVTQRPVEQKAGEPAAATVCEAGKRTSFPKTMTLDATLFPAWVAEWAVKRGFQIRQFKDTPANATIRLNSYVCAAAAFCIERYWRQQPTTEGTNVTLLGEAAVRIQTDPTARIQILSSLRAASAAHPDPSGNHTTGAGIDFSIRTATGRVPVLQNWAVLRKLAGAGLIPYGGRGLYLNMDEVRKNGIFGVLPSESGVASRSASSPNRPTETYPPGASAGAHWDFRGTFGKSGSETKYLQVDTNGDGTDDKLNADAEAYLRTKLPDVYDFYFAEGYGLPGVGRTVPNVMQVLGQEASCFTSEDA